MAEQDIPHNLLNAKPENVEREAEIVAQAGRAGSVTIATNMAGRGTDIILGGNSDYMARLKLREVLLPRLVRPEDGHKPPVPLQRSEEGGGGFSTPAQLVVLTAMPPVKLKRSAISIPVSSRRRHRSSPCGACQAAGEGLG